MLPFCLRGQFFEDHFLKIPLEGLDDINTLRQKLEAMNNVIEQGRVDADAYKICLPLFGSFCIAKAANNTSSHAVYICVYG